MKKFFIKTISFFLFALFVTSFAFLIISFVPALQVRTTIKSTTGGYGASLLRYREAQNFGEVDLVFIGSSHCYRGFDPRIFKKAGISSFNLGSSSQTPFNSIYLLRDYAPILKPKTIFLEVYWGALYNSGIESSIDIISNAPSSHNTFKMALATHKSDPIISWAFQMIHRLKFPIKKEQLKTFVYDKYVTGGYVETTRSVNRIENADLKEIPPLTTFHQLKYVDEINEYCLQNNIELILIIAPVNEEIPNHISNYSDKMIEIEKFATERDIILLNFNNKDLYHKMNLNYKVDWYDNTHLTQTGVIKFNNLLLTEFSFLLDHEHVN